MKICFFCQENILKPQGGTGTYVRNISHNLANLGHEVHVISRHYPGTKIHEKVNRINIYRVSAPGPAVLYSPLYFWQSRLLFEKLNKRSRFDVVHGNTPLMSSWGLREFSPIVETLHCTVQEELHVLRDKRLNTLNFNEVIDKFIASTWLNVEYKVLNRAERVIVVSQGLRREILKYHLCNAEKILVIPHGIDYDFFSQGTSPDRTKALRESLGVSKDEKIILYLGRLIERKRALDLVKALAEIQKQVKVKLIIVGKKTEYVKRIEKLAQKNNLTKTIKLIDHVSYQNLPEYFSIADVFALPSSYEGFPSTILEAMATGVPVVASNIPGIDEQIIDGNNGLLHSVGDIQGIAAQIIKVLKDAELAKFLITNAKPIVAEEFNWTVIGNHIEKIFVDLIS